MFREHFFRLAVVLVVMGVCLFFVSVVRGQSSANKPAVIIDTGKVGEPVSKYIYGQFIEHLGRCIYGGIWAEMLEDRKFYYAVPADGPIYKDAGGARVVSASPWQVIGPKIAVRMVTENSYVGDHTPEIKLPGDGTRCGIFQEGLGLVKGKKYTGRIVLAAMLGKELPIQISLAWGNNKQERDTFIIDKGITRSYGFRTFELRFESRGDTDNGRLEITSSGKGNFKIGAVSLMPADNVKGMRVDTLKLLKELNAPLYRWPGGNFVSGYDWRDGLGDVDRRPPRKNPAWTGIEHNDFGLDEFIVFCREINTEPMIIANSGFGDDHSAAEEVEYVNGSADTPMGKWRAKNGHAEPYNVTWWGIGNEMYGKWQLGYMKREHYVQKHNLFARAMRKVDPSIKLVAVGDVGRWSEGMLTGCADYMDLISEHFYKGAKDSVLEHVRQTSTAVIDKVKAHKKWRRDIESLKGKDIRIALDEWNYWHRPYLPQYGELGCRYTLKDALGIAVGLHEMIRNSDMIYMANYAQTVNVIGCIKTTKTEAAFATTGLPLMLYRNQFGTLPVAVSGNFEPLDVVAAWTADRSALTIGVVNPTAFNYEIGLDVTGGLVRLDSAERWLIAGSDPLAYNEPGKDANIVIIPRSKIDIQKNIVVPPLSITIYRMAVK